MKRIAIISTPVILLLLLFGSLQKATAQVDEEVSYQTFYDELSPYGNWIDYPEYGYVWQPDMGPDFRPYSTNGHWVYNDDYEWMWVSDYSWGWAPFHYGRWFYDDYYGWLWMPGYDWSPAWVCWRSGGDYYGWAPLGPQFSVGVNLSFGSYSPPSNYWCFVNRQYIASPRVYDYCYGVNRNSLFINSTTVINNYHRERNVFVTGPGRHEVERYTGQSIRSVGIRDAGRPGRTDFRNNQVSIFRPQVNRNNNRYAPERFQRFNRDNRNEVADNRGGNRFGGNNDRRGNMGGFEERRPQQDQMMRQRNADAENNRHQFEQRQQQDQMMRQRNGYAENDRGQFEQRQQQDQMMRQRNADAENNRRQFEQRQQQEQMMRQRNADAENNRRQFEQRQQQEQMMRQRNADAENNRRQFEQQRQQQEQMTRQRNAEMENNRRQFEQRQQPQYQQRNPEPGNQQGGSRFGGWRGQQGQQQPQPQAQPQQNRGDNQGGGGRFGGGSGGDNRDSRQGHGGWRRN